MVRVSLEGSLVIMCLVLLSGCKLLQTNQQKIDTLDLRPNYQINYNIAQGGERYQFIVDLIEMNPYRTFKFTMTNSNETSALIAITPKALDSGDIEKNYFPNYSDTLNDNTLTVWFSRKMFETIINNDTAIFNGNYRGFGSKKTKFYNNGTELYHYELNGVPQTIEVIHVKEANRGGKQFWVLNNPENPLIVKMNVGWEIWLKEVNHNYDD